MMPRHGIHGKKDFLYMKIKSQLWFKNSNSLRRPVTQIKDFTQTMLLYLKDEIKLIKDKTSGPHTIRMKTWLEIQDSTSTI